MDSLRTKISELADAYSDAAKKLSIDQKNQSLIEMTDQQAEPDFWQKTESSEAQHIAKASADLESFLRPWNDLRSTITELTEFIELEDPSLQSDLEHKLKSGTAAFERLKKDLRFTGEYDASSVVMNIQAGAGGLDAQDWAHMLEKMYLKWAEKQSLSVSVLSQSFGDEGGIKNSTLQIEGPFVYGKLKSEHGVHRLVRISPFNSGGTRETSFAMVEVIPQIDAPEEFALDDGDVRVDVYRAGGKGGQSVNTTDSAVRVTHEPTGIVVSIQNERSQTQNKDTALRILASRLASLAREQHKEKLSDLKGPNQENSWGSQIRSYVLHPYTMVKDGRTGLSLTDVSSVLEGEIDPLIESFLETTMGQG